MEEWTHSSCLHLVQLSAVYEETLRTIDILGKGGGLIIAPSQEIMNNVPVENVLAFMKAVKHVRGEDK